MDIFPCYRHILFICHWCEYNQLSGVGNDLSVDLSSARTSEDGADNCIGLHSIQCKLNHLNCNLQSLTVLSV